MLNRAGLNKLIQTYPKAILAREFSISLPSLRKYLREEPAQVAVVEHLNRHIARLLAS